MAGFLEDLYKQVPLNARLFVDSLRGVTTPVTEKDLRPDEIQVLQDIHRKRQNQLAMGEKFVNARPDFSPEERIQALADMKKIYGAKQIGYNDYYIAPDQQGWLGSLMSSFSDPKYRIATSLGNFGMEPQGNNLRVYDKYNWNGDFAYPVQNLGDLFKQTRLTNPTEILNGLAEMFAPKVTRPVEINIPQK